MKRAFLRFSYALVLVSAVLIPGCGGTESSSLDVPTVVEESYTTQTADGWTIAIHRYYSSAGVTHQEPVFLSQGFLEGARVFHAFPKYSLAGKLALEGHDVWSYDIRGVGDSQKPELDWDNLKVDFSIDWSGINFSIGMEGWDYSMDHFILLDTPAALDFVLKATGKPQVNWIAHSLGALMQYAYLQTKGASKVKAAISMGGIGVFDKNHDYQSLFAEIFFGIGTFLAPFVPSNLPLPLKWALDKLLGKDPLKWAAICYALDTVVGKLFWNHENMNPNLVYQFLKYALPNTTTNCFKQFMEWTKTGECKLKGVTLPDSQGFAAASNSGFTAVASSSDPQVTIAKDYNVTANLRNIKTPLLVLSGGADLMCPAGQCEEVYRQVSSKRKQYIECSKKTGHTVDYGHVDMALGLFARNEVYPHVQEWLEEHSTRR